MVEKASERASDEENAQMGHHGKKKSNTLPAEVTSEQVRVRMQNTTSISLHWHPR